MNILVTVKMHRSILRKIIILNLDRPLPFFAGVIHQLQSELLVALQMASLGMQIMQLKKLQGHMID